MVFGRVNWGKKDCSVVRNGLKKELSWQKNEEKLVKTKFIDHF